MKSKSSTSYTVRGSGYSAFSVLGFLCFFLIIPVALVLFAILDCNPYINGEEGAFGLTKSLVDGGTLQADGLENIVLVCYAAAAVIALLTLIIVLVKVHIKRCRTYTFEENVLTVKRATFFTDHEESRKIFYSPGMSVSVEQSFKGWLCNYGTVVIGMGLGNAGEIVMRNVKRPRKVRKELVKRISSVSYMGYPHSWNIPNMCNSPYGYGFGFPYFGGFGCYNPYSFFGGNCENGNNCPMANNFFPMMNTTEQK